jgi:hypothetical protein
LTEPADSLSAPGGAVDAPGAPGEPGSGERSAPVLALIRRLPLDLDEERSGKS